MNSINMEQPINKQSFFKLPLIFIAIFLVIYFVGTQLGLFLMRDMPLEKIFQHLIFVFLGRLLELFLFFVTAIFCCQKYRLHSVIDSWLKVTLIAIVFSLLYWAWTILWSFAYGILITKLHQNMNMDIYEIVFKLNIISFFIKIISSTLFILILIFLFYLFAKRDASLRSMFKLEGKIGSRIYAHVYSFLTLFLSVVFVSYGLRATLMSISRSSGFDNLTIISLLLMLASLFISYMIFYFSTRNCFKRIEPTVKLGKLIATVCLTYLFIFLASLVVIGIFFIFIWQSLMMGYYTDFISIVTSILILFCIGCVVNFVLYFVFSRLSVKIMYG